MVTFQELIKRLTNFWESKGCLIHQGYDLEVGAGTMNPATFLRALGPEPYNAAYVEPCRRPSDGRYGDNPNRTQHYFQYQVIMKPSPLDFQELYLESLAAIGIDLKAHDIRFVHDDWENPTIGAWGLGWEVWLDGMEVTQFTYFQGLGGQTLSPVTGELTYGLERIAMYLQNVDSFFDLKWNDHILYGDIYHRGEVEWSHYNFEEATTSLWFSHFDDYEKEAGHLIANHLPIPAYEFVMKASHAFNILDARGAISVTERMAYIRRIRSLAKQIATAYVASREKAGFPLKTKFPQLPAKDFTQRPLPDALSAPKEGAKETLLLEIGMEELPSRYVSIGCDQLYKKIQELLSAHNLRFETIKVYGTPRRLAVSVEGVPLSLPAQDEIRRGPPILSAFDASGALTKIGEGFLRSIDIPSLTLNELKNQTHPTLKIEIQKGKEYLFATLKKPALIIGQLLADHFPKLLSQLEFPKIMRWSDQEATFARPIRWIAALLGEEIIPFHYAEIHSSNKTYGHRQLANHPIPLSSAKLYEELLKKNHVIASREERKALIQHSLRKIEGETGGKIIQEEKVLKEVLDLIEEPHMTFASFNENFLTAPREVLIQEMVEHQKYFPIENTHGELLNLFVITGNNTPSDMIRKGNQKVLSARLADGVFLYEKGLKTSLDEYAEKLQHVTFLKGMGSLSDKVLRLMGHGEVLQRLLNLSQDKWVRRACQLCKADLVTEMVGEFPELQGTIGKYYALNQKEDPEVAEAIEEQWMPKGENAPLPQSQTGVILSLADKFDTLIACFSAGLKPTSSKDPYALRRQAIGILKILIKEKAHIDLPDLLNRCCNNFVPSRIRNKPILIEELLAFFTQRGRSLFQELGFSKEEIAAALGKNMNDPYASYKKLQALSHFRQSGHEFTKLFEVYKRARGQIEGESKEMLNPSLCEEPAEQKLLSTLENTEIAYKEALERHEYARAYQLLAELQPLIAGLFEEVKILADDERIRRNRIALLQAVFARFTPILDFSEISEKI